MKLGITTNVFAGPLKNKEIDLEGIVSMAGELRLASVEIRDDPAVLDPSRVRSLVSLALASGMSLSYAVKNDMFGKDDRLLFERAVRLASECGPGTVLRLLASQDALKAEGKNGYSAEDVEKLRSIMEEYGRVAAGSGVVLAIENARDPLYGREGYFGMADLMRSVTAENVGLTFDPANATNFSLCKSPSGEDEVLRFVDELGRRIKLTHYKTTSSGVVQTTIGTADVDNEALLLRLSKVFSGILCIEIPGSPGLSDTIASVESSISYLNARGLSKYLA